MKRTLHRRRFLAASAATVAAPYFVPASALGLQGQPPPSERITIGCIGVKGQGTWNMNNFMGFDDCRVVAVCDLDSNHLKAAAQVVNTKYANSDCKTYKDYRE